MHCFGTGREPVEDVHKTQRNIPSEHPCKTCDGTGKTERWMPVKELSKMVTRDMAQAMKRATARRAGA